MSKDKYRPSIADYEVVDSGGSVRSWRGGSFGTITRPGLDTSIPEGGGMPFPSIDDEIITDDWYPKNLRVEKQEIRYNPQGRMRVDVTFAWDALEGAESYYLRVARIEDGE